MPYNMPYIRIALGSIFGGWVESKIIIRWFPKQPHVWVYNYLKMLLDDKMGETLKNKEKLKTLSFFLKIFLIITTSEVNPNTKYHYRNYFLL